jgi:hypothetical protein
MGRLIVRRVEKELKAICQATQAVKHHLRRVLEAIEKDPSSFKELEEIPERIRAIPGVTVRKAEIKHDPHNYRLVFLHFRTEEGKEWSEVIYAFRRRKGYALDWEWIENLLPGS